MEAISNGATGAVVLVSAIVANLIVFLALLAFVDSIVDWFAQMIGYQGWTFEVYTFLHICSPCTQCCNLFSVCWAMCFSHLHL